MSAVTLLSHARCGSDGQEDDEQMKTENNANGAYTERSWVLWLQPLLSCLCILRSFVWQVPTPRTTLHVCAYGVYNDHIYLRTIYITTDTIYGSTTENSPSGPQFLTGLDPLYLILTSETLFLMRQFLSRRRPG